VPDPVDTAELDSGPRNPFHPAGARSEMVAETRWPDPRVADAIEFAVTAHRQQTRKDGRTPYIVHPVAVLRRLSSDLGVEDPDLLCTAVLHDVVEDSAVPPEELQRRFGPRVAAWVQELTVPPELHGPTVPDERKTEQLVRDIGRMSWEAVLVKLCDRWDNLRDMANAPWGPEKSENYRAQTREILRALDGRWSAHPPPPNLVSWLTKARAGLDVELARR
jgi:GTP diphosphokinase / guanosine-3',5'-bis(diphosphate) 3'-diphosphatase